MSSHVLSEPLYAPHGESFWAIHSDFLKVGIHVVSTNWLMSFTASVPPSVGRKTRRWAHRLSEWRTFPSTDSLICPICGIAQYQTADLTTSCSDLEICCLTGEVEVSSTLARQRSLTQKVLTPVLVFCSEFA